VKLRLASCAVAALGAAVALTGCGSDALALDPVAKAATTTSGKQSFRFSFRTTDGTPAGAANGDGAYDADGKRLRMTFTVPFGNAGSTMKMDLLTDASSGMVVYLRFPLLSAFLPQGKTWVKVDVARAASAKGIDLDQLVQTTQTNPAELLSTLVHSKGSQKVGDETIDGVAATHYRVTVDPQEALVGKLTGELRTRLEQLLAKQSIHELPVDVWVDGDDLVRRLKLDVPRLASSSTAGGPVTFVEDLSGYGDPVTVELPAAAGVVDASNGKLGG
jgi:hypothetical protein